MKTSRDDGLAHFVIDYGAEADLLRVVFLNEDGACWSVPNPRELPTTFICNKSRR